ncbi:transcriptional regulator [Natronococcus sp. A-GB7]|uniref:transcriptional regulator n=1 Tax=Natronococcus sp. A-GB7 TaxID=3037649 RepID=UPI00241F4897|nr:transcriptional regulator [Natronococcus sp. A-GB7]MDG5821390.1 transcriptional regulator [Natronococcus sp. A-GB7]
MAELNPIAKRMHNISPDPVELTFDDGTNSVFTLSGAEFFQQEFQAEGTCSNDDAEYRFISSSDNESVLVGRKGPDDSGWTNVGTVVEVHKVENE